MTGGYIYTALAIALVIAAIAALSSRGRPSEEGGILIYKYPPVLKYICTFGFLFALLVPFVITKTGFGFSVYNLKYEDAATLFGLAALAALELFGIFYINNYEIRVYDDKVTYGIAKRMFYFADVLEVKHRVSGVGAVLIVLRNKKRISFTNSISGFYDLERTLKQRVAAIHQRG